MSADNAPFKWPDGKRTAVSLTFDDARASQVDNGIPILDKYGIKATFYVSLGADFDARLDKWRAAVAAGHEIGNHSKTHPCSANFGFCPGNSLEDLDLERIEQDLLEANDIIQDKLGVLPRTFAYPCGQTFVGRGQDSASYVSVVAKHFLVGRVFRSEISDNPAVSDLARTCGTEADGRSFEQLKGLAEACASNGRWLVLAAHDVADDRGQAMGTDVLEAFCAYLSDPTNGFWTDTALAVGEYIHKTRS